MTSTHEPPQTVIGDMHAIPPEPPEPVLLVVVVPPLPPLLPPVPPIPLVDDVVVVPAPPLELELDELVVPGPAPSEHESGEITTRATANILLRMTSSEGNQPSGSSYAEEHRRVQRMNGTARCSDRPSRDTTRPSRDTTRPSRDTTRPSDDTTRPSDDTTRPSDDTTRPSDDTTRPSDDTTRPSDDTTRPSDDTTRPSRDSTRPSDDTTRPSDDTTRPSDDTTRASDDTTWPSRYSTRPSRDSTRPSRDSTRPSRDSTRPSRDSTVVAGSSHPPKSGWISSPSYSNHEHMHSERILAEMDKEIDAARRRGEQLNGARTQYAAAHGLPAGGRRSSKPHRHQASLTECRTRPLPPNESSPRWTERSKRASASSTS